MSLDSVEYYQKILSEAGIEAKVEIKLKYGHVELHAPITSTRNPVVDVSIWATGILSDLEEFLKGRLSEKDYQHVYNELEECKVLILALANYARKNGRQE